MDKRQEAFQIALVGCGEVTEHKHLPALREIEGVEVVAVVDHDRRRLDHVADRFNIPHRLTDVRSLLDQRNLRAVGVCVPPHSHAASALPLIEAGKHLLIEKPLALSMDEADELIEKTRQTGVKVMVGFHMRWHRLVRQAREIVQSSKLGDPETIRSIWNSPRGDLNLPEWKARRELGGGALVEIAVHHFDLWRFLLNTEVTEVFSLCRHGKRDDESAVVAAKLANGMMASAVFSERSGHNIEVEVCGDRARLKVQCQRFDGLEICSTRETPGMLRPRLVGIASTLRELPRGISRTLRGGDYRHSYTAEWRHFVDSIRNGTTPECELEDGRKALQVVMAAVESASRNEPVKVGEAPRSIRPARA